MYVYIILLDNKNRDLSILIHQNFMSYTSKTYKYDRIY